MYYALYRKYRPKKFSDVVGQQNIITTLKNSIKNNCFSHAYIFYGPRGTGKTTISKILARAINCSNNIDGDACGKCQNCNISFERECVDIIEIDAASNNGVDEIRELRNKISLVPSKLKYKVYIIDEVHMLSIGAFNALLKTLEEPPEHAVFILATTDYQKVPETIVSRCQTFSFQRISEINIVERLKKICKLEKITITDDVLKKIAIYSEGGMRDALGMLDKLAAYTTNNITMKQYVELNGIIDDNDLKQFVSFIFNNKIKETLLFINKCYTDGKNFVQILLQIMYYLRDMLVDNYISNVASPYPILQMQQLVSIINESMFDIKKSGNPKIYVEMLLLKFITSNSNSDNDLSVKKNLITDLEKNNNSNINIKKEKSIKDNVTDKKTSSEIVNKQIANIEEIINVRINNTLATANKQTLRKINIAIKIFENFTFDKKIGYLASAILDAKVRVAGDGYILLSYEYDSIVQQNIKILDKINALFNEKTNMKVKIAIVSDYEWEKIKKEYILNIKNKRQYKILEEPSVILEKNEKTDIMSDSAEELFGDVVVVE